MARRDATFLVACGMLASAAAHATDLPQPTARTATLDARWRATFATEVRTFSWTGSRGTPTSGSDQHGHGLQVYTPYAVQLEGRPHDDLKVELLARGGWVHARQSTAGLAGSVSTQTDTVVSGTITYTGLDRLQPFIALGSNMPTGRSALPGSAAYARMDPDLVELSTYGEGWTVGPTAGVTVPLLPSLMLTMAVGYTWRGAFDRESSLTAGNPGAQSTTSVDPGEVLTLTASAAFTQGPWSVLLAGTVSEESRTTENGAPLYRPGRRYLGTVTVTRSWPERWGITTLTGAVAHANRNAVQFLGASGLATEPFNTNSTLYRIGLQHLVPMGPLWLGPTASFLCRDSNGYDAATLQFVPAKERVAAGVTGQWSASQTITLNARVEHVWTHEHAKDADNGQQFSVLANALVPGSAVPVVSSRGWQVAGGLSVRF